MLWAFGFTFGADPTAEEQLAWYPPKDGTAKVKAQSTIALTFTASKRAG